MVIFSAVKLKELFEKERDYPWQKPERCPCCNDIRLWGHGFTDAIFDGYEQPLLIKLYRCPDCGCVIRLRPKGYFKRFQASIETIRRWIRLYNKSNGDLKSLFPKDRSDQGKSRAMDDYTCSSLVELRLQMPAATVPRLVEQMNRRKLVTPGIVLNNSTVYRFLHQEDLMIRAGGKPKDRRKFEAELPNDLWQSYVMHGPKVDVDGKMRKSYLIAIIDDHSRLIIYAKFYLSETLASYLDVFKNALARRGLPRKLYVDNGAAFRSKHLGYITASLDIALIHSKPYTPQGKGKIERWFKTVRTRFLADYTVTTLAEFNAAFNTWLNEDYNQKNIAPPGKPHLIALHLKCIVFGLHRPI